MVAYHRFGPTSPCRIEGVGRTDTVHHQRRLRTRRHRRCTCKDRLHEGHRAFGSPHGCSRSRGPHLLNPQIKGDRIDARAERSIWPKCHWPRTPETVARGARAKRAPAQPRPFLKPRHLLNLEMSYRHVSDISAAPARGAWCTAYRACATGRIPCTGGNHHLDTAAHRGPTTFDKPASPQCAPPSRRSVTYDRLRSSLLSYGSQAPTASVVSGGYFSHSLRAPTQLPLHCCEIHRLRFPAIASAQDKRDLKLEAARKIRKRERQQPAAVVA
jgi:hypothetical protein